MGVRPTASHKPTYHAEKTNATHSPTNKSFPFQRQLLQSLRLWYTINNFDPCSDSPQKLHELVALSFVLEEHILLEAQQILLYPSKAGHNFNHPRFVSAILDFYSQPKVPHHKTKTSKLLLTNQLFSYEQSRSTTQPSSNYFNKLYLDDPETCHNMDIDEEPPTQDIQIKHFNQKTVT
jgi:hypothetical protein